MLPLRNLASFIFSLGLRLNGSPNRSIRKRKISKCGINRPPRLGGVQVPVAPPVSLDPLLLSGGASRASPLFLRQTRTFVVRSQGCDRGSIEANACDSWDVSVTANASSAVPDYISAPSNYYRQHAPSQADVIDR
jgi:hypothetical protein